MNKLSEEQVKKALKIDDFRSIPKAKIMDFVSLIPNMEQVKKIESSNEMCQRLFLQPACLKPEVPPDIIFSVIYSLIMNIKNKDILPFAHMETFDFMVDHLIDSLYK